MTGKFQKMFLTILRKNKEIFQIPFFFIWVLKFHRDKKELFPVFFVKKSQLFPNTVKKQNKYGIFAVKMVK